ncbi:MAG: cobalamin-dependent protein [Methanoregula sp.]
MTATKTSLYHPVSLNREYLAGKMLEKVGKKHSKQWNNFSIEHRVQVREAFLESIRSLEESLATGTPAFLIDQALWEKSRFSAGNFPSGFVVSFFKIFKKVLSVDLPQDYQKNAIAFAVKTVSVLKSKSAGTGTSADTRTTLSPAAQSFLKAVLGGDPARGRAVIEKALGAGTPVSEIYTGIFQPVLRETGLLWQQNKATIAQEHFVAGVIRQIMEQIHDRVAATRKTKRQKKRVVAACVGEELHEIGIRMVADFFEMDGWDVYFTGANTPAKSILAAVQQNKAGVLALSITMPSRLSDLRYLVRLLRADADTAHVKIIVGGYPFSILPDLWKQVGADAVAAGAEEAVAAANQLTTGIRRTE